MTAEAVHRSNPPINAKDFGVPAEFAERAENYVQWAIAAERDRMIADGWRQCAKGQKTTQWCAQAADRLARHGIQIPEDEDGNSSF